MKQQAAREAVDMIATIKKKKIMGKKVSKPVHCGKRICLSSNIGKLVKADKTKNFDYWLQLRCIGNKIKLNIPIKSHRMFKKWDERGKRSSSVIIHKNYVQFSFEIETGKKKEITNCIGIDTGINCLASLSTGEQIGKDVKYYIEIIKRRKSGSKNQKRAIITLKEYLSRVAKIIIESDISLVVIEDLKNITTGTKLKGRLSRSIRSSIGKWNVSYWLKRVEEKCEENRVSFRRINPRYTSQTCNCCGHVDRKNRNGEKFRCLLCGHKANADINAAKNILQRFFTGKYGSGFKAEMILNTII